MQFNSAIPDIARYRVKNGFAESSDDALIEAIANGDKGALMVLFAQHSVRVYRFALSLTGNSLTAEDIVTEVFFDVSHQAAGFEAQFQVSTWLLAIARCKAISVLRRRSEGQLDEDFASTIENSAHDSEESTNKNGSVQHCLKQLSPLQREIIDLVYYHEKSVAEVAAIVDAPEETVKTRMFCARKRLAELLVSNRIHPACQ